MADVTDIPDSPEARFRTGVELFNRGAYFEAHEVWEEVWRDCPSAERRFYQALIQAAVAVYHWSRGNAAGARRLYHSGRRYMEPFRPVYRGLAVEEFWDALAGHLAGALGADAPTTAPPPTITIR